MKFLPYIIKCIHFEMTLFGTFRYNMCELSSTTKTFNAYCLSICQSILSISNEEQFFQTTVGCTASYFVKIICRRWFCTPYSFVTVSCFVGCPQKLVLLDVWCFILFLVKGKIEKVPRGIRGEKSSKDMAISRNLVSTIGALASLKVGDGTRCPEG